MKLKDWLFKKYGLFTKTINFNDYTWDLSVMAFIGPQYPFKIILSKRPRKGFKYLTLLSSYEHIGLMYLRYDTYLSVSTDFKYRISLCEKAVFNVFGKIPEKIYYKIKY